MKKRSHHTILEFAFELNQELVHHLTRVAPLGPEVDDGTRFLGELLAKVLDG